jgi:Cytochrome P450
MVNVTYNIPELAPPAIYSARLSLSILLLTALALPFIFLLFGETLKDKYGHPIPPGPLIRYPFLRRHSERALRAWSRTYGPLFSLWMGNQLFVVISDAHIAKDLLVSNSAIFSSRKPYFIKSQTILRGRGITVTAYNDKW